MDQGMPFTMRSLHSLQLYPMHCMCRLQASVRPAPCVSVCLCLTLAETAPPAELDPVTSKRPNDVVGQADVAPAKRPRLMSSSSDAPDNGPGTAAEPSGDVPGPVRSTALPPTDHASELQRQLQQAEADRVALQLGALRAEQWLRRMAQRSVLQLLPLRPRGSSTHCCRCARGVPRAMLRI